MGTALRQPRFTLAGLTEHPQLKFVLFGLFLGTYTLTLAGNLGLIVLIRVSPQLHTPRYFFLSALSFLGVCCSSTISPRMLLDLPADPRAISLAGCLAQLYFYAASCTAEVAVMAYDRYVAVSRPFLYRFLMPPSLCVRLVAGCFLVVLLSAATHTGMATNLLVFGSYACATAAAGRMGPGAGRSKACSTCSAHLAALGIFYVSVTVIYMQPSSARSLRSKKVASVFYTVAVPLVNPVVYSPRNEEVKKALSGFVGRMHF